MTDSKSSMDNSDFDTLSGENKTENDDKNTNEESENEIDPIMLSENDTGLQSEEESEGNVSDENGGYIQHTISEDKIMMQIHPGDNPMPENPTCTITIESHDPKTLALEVKRPNKISITKKEFSPFFKTRVT